MNKGKTKILEVMTLPAADSETQDYPEPGRFLGSLGMDWMWEWEKPRLGTPGSSGKLEPRYIIGSFF